MKKVFLLLAIAFSLVSLNHNRNDEKINHIGSVSNGRIGEIFSIRQSSSDDKSKGLEVLNTCVNNYLNLSRFKMDVEYSVFYNNTTDFSIPNDKEIGKIICKNNNFYQEEMGDITILNDDYELNIVSNSEVLVIAPRTTEELVPVAVDLDSLASQIEKVEKIENGYRFYTEYGPIEKFDLIIDKNGFLYKWRNFYREKMDFGAGEVHVVTQLKYYNFFKNPKIDSKIFSIDKYVSVDKTGKVVPQGDYKNYYVINQIPQK